MAGWGSEICGSSSSPGLTDICFCSIKRREQRFSIAKQERQKKNDFKVEHNYSSLNLQHLPLGVCLEAAEEWPSLQILCAQNAQIRGSNNLFHLRK